jgi:hypothetical protein
MLWSLAPLVAACALLAGLAGTCTFAPDATTTRPVPSYDAVGALRADAAALGFPIRLPRLPQGWQANSGNRGGIDNGRTDQSTGQRLRAVTSTVGYISPTGMYVSLTQSNADEDKLVDSIRSSSRPTVHPTGTVDVDGTSWVVYQGEGVEPVWTARLDAATGPAQLAVTGAGSADQFRTLAAATQSQPPLPAKG